MGKHVWCFIAALFLVSVKGQGNENVAQFYDKPQSSSPAPPQATSSDQRLTGMKEVILYLTPNQVEALQAAGAVVRPIPQLEKDSVQPQYQQRGEEQTEPQYQTEPLKQDPELDEFYKVLNIKQINEDLPTQLKYGERTTAKPRPKYKYTAKSRQQDYSASYVQKKANRIKSSSSGYVRYLPNYESQNLKMEPLYPQSLPGYRFEGSPLNAELNKYLQTEAPQVQKPERIIPIVELQEQEQTESPLSVQINEGDKEPMSFEEKVRESKKAWLAKLQERIQMWNAAKTWEPPRVQDFMKVQTPQGILKVLDVGEPLLRVQEKMPNNSPLLPSEQVQNQFSSLLAPLIQHTQMADSTILQKEELVNSEKEIRSMLQDIKESGTHDEAKFAEGIDKLSKNLDQQNALAEKLALETASMKSQSQGLGNDEVQLPKESLTQVKPSQPSPLVSIVEPLKNKAPAIFPSPLELLRPIPELKRDQTETKKALVSSNIYMKENNPYLLQKVVPVKIKHEFPVKYPIYPEDKFIIRPLWEH